MDTFARGTLLAASLALLANAAAAPVNYELDVVAGDVSGTLGNTSFSNALLILEFQGDTTNVVPFSRAGTTPSGQPITVTGYENVVGTATVHIIDPGTGQLVGQGTFLPAAGIFVAVDNTQNHGIGFGSFGGLPGSAQFPGEVIYPAAMLSPTPSIVSYDLKSDLSASGFAFSCVGFPGACAAAKPLPTTSGDLLVNHFGISQSFFSATVQTVVAFSDFDAEFELHTSPAAFDIDGSFTLGAASNGISPRSETVTLQVDAISLTIPAGSFELRRREGYRFEGNIDGVALEFSIHPHGATRYTFHVEGAGAAVAQLTRPVTLQLTIGGDSGSVTVPAKDN
jgi:hypothetical protein